MFDLIVRDASLADGSGRPVEAGVDIAVEGGLIVEVGRDLAGRSKRTVDADGRLVTPGFVDNHTHYDGQATWDEQLAPSAWHGVTTVIMGNCGVGVAPAHPDRREWTIALMEGVEDIPGAVLTEGMKWEWESFPEYLDALDARRRVLDIATQVPHAAVRGYVMGDRGAANEDPTDEDLDAMARIVAEGMQAGALGFSTSRTMLHRMPTGEVVAGSFAGAKELLTLGYAMARSGTGVFQLASDVGVDGSFEGRYGADLDWMTELAGGTGRPVTFALLQSDRDPEHWRRVLDRTGEAARNGSNLVALTPVRSVGILLGHQTSLHPFKMHPSYVALEHLDLEQRVALLRTDEVRSRILSEQTMFTGRFNHDIAHGFWKMYPLGARPDYEPLPENSIQATAQREGRDPYELCYDLMLEDDGRALLFFPLSDYAYGNLDSTLERLQHPGTLASLADGGAHCGLVCDASSPTFMLSFWARDRARGARLPLETAVALQTSKPARLYGLGDRGLVAPGYRADLNIIDFDALQLGAPYVAFDLPANGRRLLQRATGYVATVCAGEVTYEEREPTGATPGRLIRGAKPQPGRY